MDKKLKTLKDIIQQMLDETPHDNHQRIVEIKIFEYQSREAAREWVKELEKNKDTEGDTNIGELLITYYAYEEDEYRPMIRILNHIFNFEE